MGIWLVFGPSLGAFMDWMFTCHLGSDPMGDFVSTPATISPAAVRAPQVPTSYGSPGPYSLWLLRSLLPTVPQVPTILACQAQALSPP